MDEIQWGYCDIHHSRVDEVIAILEKHNATRYLIGLEICDGDKHSQTNGEHMHFVLHIKPVDFKNLKEKLRRTFNLAGKNNKQGKAFYGWMKKDIKNIDKLKAYTLKDQNIRSKGYTEEELQEIIEQSFPKNEERNIYKECIKAIDQQRPYIMNRTDVNTSLYIDTMALEQFIMKFHMENGVKICYSKIKSIATSYLQLEYTDRYKHLEEIFYYIKNK